MKILNNHLGIIALSLILGLSIIGSCKKEKEPGKISIYKSSDLGVGDIEIFVDGVPKGSIATGRWYLDAPSCGSTLCLNAQAPSDAYFGLKAVADDGSEWSFNKQVSDGECDLIELTLSSRTKIPPPPITKGDVVFWETAASGCSGTTDVTINGVTNQISSLSVSTPSCGSSGNACFSLNSGSYSYSASCLGTIKTGTVTVTANQCTPVQLNWNSPPPIGTGQLVFWESITNGCNNITDVTINGITNQISNFSAFAPACGSTGNATFSLSSGTYNYTANCSGTPKTGTAVVTANQCTPIQLIWTNPNTSGYNCSNNTCSYVSNNATYGTLSECQNACSGPPSNYGKVIFYRTTQILCDIDCTCCDGNIQVDVNGLTTSAVYSLSAPNCDWPNDAGTFYLLQGTYSYVATKSCHCTTTNGSFIVTPGGCTKVNVYY